MAQIDAAGDAAIAKKAAEVHLYTLAGCGACSIARRLLRRRNIRFKEIRGESVPGFRTRLQHATGGRTVPQVVIDGEPIGGANSLLALDRLGILVARVKRERFPVAVVRRRWSPIRMFAGRSPRRYEVRLVDRYGRTLERLEDASMDEATTLDSALR